MSSPTTPVREHRTRETRAQLALQAALVIYGFTVMVQGQLFLRYVLPSLASERPPVPFLLALPFLQWQTVIAALLVAAAVYWGARRRAHAGIAWFLVTAVLVLVAFDQLVFKRFHDHMTLSQTDGGVLDLGIAIPRLLGSAASDADVMTYINFAMLAVLIPALYRRIVAREAPRGAANVPRTAPVLIALGAYAALAVPLVRNVRDRFELDRFPLTGLLWRDAEEVTEPAEPTKRAGELRRLRDMTWKRDTAADAALYARAGTLRAAHRRHVIFFVLESVGAHQLLPSGLPDSAVTPNLARLANDALIFPQIYGVYPATTRAHVPIMTGGRSITWGSVGDELTLPLAAPTMVSVFRAAGYRTALFAAPDLRFGYLREFYRTMPWDTVVHYQDGTPTLTKEQEIHSWGVNEDALRPLIARWLDQSPASRPQFIEFHTIATHHPYGTWGGDLGPSSGEDDAARYKNSLHYTDAAIGRLLDDLRVRGILDQSLIVITGDHGEAFADLHADNWVHRNRLYEENIRNFLFVAAPGLGGGAVVSPRIGQHGDLLATMTNLLGLPHPDVPGQDLTSTGYQPRIAYFHKDSRPAQFGLRDGRWKYIAHLDGRQPELYDLTVDPTEQQNLATRHLDRVRQYRDLAAEWFVWANYDYARLLIGFDTTRHRRVVTRANYARIEPPQLRVGHFLRGEGEGFVETPILAPNDPLFVWNRWSFLPDDINVRIRLVSPRRAVFEYDFHIAAEWEVSWYHPGLDLAKEEGAWEVSIWSKGDRLATEWFQVRRSTVPALRDSR